MHRPLHQPQEGFGSSLLTHVRMLGFLESHSFFGGQANKEMFGGGGRRPVQPSKMA